MVSRKRPHNDRHPRPLCITRNDTRSHKRFLAPFLVFLDLHRTTSKTMPQFPPEVWKVPYFFGHASPRTAQDKEAYLKVKSWIWDNRHYRMWLRDPTSMYAPRQYMIPELRKLLIVTPRYFGAHFLPSYNPGILDSFSREQYRGTRSKFTHIGLRYLVAYCHGVPMSRICLWSGKTEADVHKDVLDSLDGFINTLPYWIWAYRVDMRAIPFTQKRNSRSAFVHRLATWNALNDYPQFANIYKTKIFLPKYLQNPLALSSLPKKKGKKPIDRLLLTVPTNRELPHRPLLHYKSTSIKYH